MFRRISPLCLTLLVLALASPLWAEPATDDDGDGSPDTEDCDDTDDQNFPENSELCDGQDNDCDGEANFGGGGAETWEAVQGGSMSNSPYTKGTVMVASSTAQLSTFAMYLDIPVGSNVTLTVAEGTAPGGPFDMVAQDVVAGTGTPEFHEIAANVSLTAGMYYFFGGTWVSATGHYYASGGSSTSGWVEPEWGAFVHGAWSNGGSPPSVSWTPGSLPSGAYTIRLTTGGGGELDEDGDGSWSCEDCDDSDAGNRPGGTEVCDGQDNDCDETTEATGGETDGDGDGYIGCLDCNDTNVNANPGMSEICDGMDNNCDGVVDEASDEDEDGWTICGEDEVADTGDEDCDDDDNEVYPFNLEICDGKDNDCDETTDETIDNDGDGVSACDGDCNDADPAWGPEAEETCDGLDTNCDGVVPADELDGDGDGQSPCEGDCDDEDDLTYQGAPEQCDRIDNDCQGAVGAEEKDEDGDGLTPCEGDCDDGDAESNPSADEVCDGKDNDCDEVIPAEEADEDGDGYLACADDCNDSASSAYPGALEICDDGIDNDCDGSIDTADPICEGEGAGGAGDNPQRRVGCSCEAGASKTAPSVFGILAFLGLGLASRRRRRQLCL